uniref:Uncharacterized protein n=1 Tax=Arundo donax TaxID=35708 RepID=A0A0A9A4E1_ARUDO
MKQANCLFMIYNYIYNPQENKKQYEQSELGLCIRKFLQEKKVCQRINIHPCQHQKR